MRDSIYNVKSSGLGGIVKDIGRTARVVKKAHKQRQERIEREIKAKAKEEAKRLKEEQKKRKKVYKNLPKHKTGNWAKAKGVKPKREGYKPRGIKHNKWGDRIA